VVIPRKKRERPSRICWPKGAKGGRKSKVDGDPHQFTGDRRGGIAPTGCINGRYWVSTDKGKEGKQTPDFGYELMKQARGGGGGPAKKKKKGLGGVLLAWGGKAEGGDVGDIFMQCSKIPQQKGEKG